MHKFVQPRKHIVKSRSIPALIDVARKAGVGAGTVSRVINGGRNVSPRTLAAVQAAIQKLGYYPSHAARSLKGAHTKTIGLIVPSVADPFFSSAAAAIQQVADDHGCLVLLAASDNDPEKERKHIALLIQRRVDGLILAPTYAPDIKIIEDAGFSTVCFDRPIKGSGIAAVVGDNYGGAKAATEHLIQQGYRRILCISQDPKLYSSQQRLRAYRGAMRKVGLPPLVEREVQNYAALEATLLPYLKSAEPIDAIFSTKNSTTIYVYQFLRKIGCRIPNSVALLGYDDFTLADTLEPPISVVRQPVMEIGRRAAELLFQQMKTGNQSHETEILGVNLILRASSGSAVARR
jgi:LacI family transcriptional regulator